MEASLHKEKTSGKRYKQHQKFQLDTKHFFIVRTSNHCNNLFRDAVESLVEVFKAQLERVREHSILSPLPTLVWVIWSSKFPTSCFTVLRFYKDTWYLTQTFVEQKLASDSEYQ